MQHSGVLSHAERVGIDGWGPFFLDSKGGNLSKQLSTCAHLSVKAGEASSVKGCGEKSEHLVGQRTF